ncbi:single-stranded DNA-binding protein [Streptococcus salivarius]|uniref:single-stranded DNA-binding protein n=1 Tax=Streptococcus salivarius TaxID=1304 RepID=UPI001899F0B9|nr:single-stranded DNA-binding protein [Streptococcus salivarius]
MNNVCMSGRLAVVPEIKITKSGKEVVNATIAINRNRKDANGARIADFFDFTVWGQTAEYLAKFADKGARIEISGALRQQKYTNVAGQIVYSVYIEVGSLEIIDYKENKENKAESKPASSDGPNYLTGAPVDIPDDGMPF